MSVKTLSRMNFNSAGTTNPLLFGSAGSPASSISALRTNGITTDGAYWFSTTKQPTAFQAYVKFNYIAIANQTSYNN